MNKQRKACFDDELLDHIRFGWNMKARPMLNPELAQAYDNFGTLLHYAVSWNNEAIVRYLLELGADVDCLDSAGRTPLMLAVERRHAPNVKVLLEANSSVDVIDHQGASALHMAFDEDFFDLEIVQAFLRRIQAETGTTEELVERLTGAGCSLYHATLSTNTELIERMLRRGIDVNSEGPHQKTALHAAAELNDLNLVNWLIKNGARVNSLDGNGCNALLYAALNGNKYMANILLEKGIDPNCNDGIHDRTPIFVVFENLDQAAEEKVEFAELLLQYGAIPQNSMTRDRTIFDYASFGSSDKGVKMLIAHLAMLEALGTPITESVMHCTNERNQLNLSKFSNFHVLCQQVLTINVFKEITLLDLLNESKINMRLLVRKETFVPEVERVCSVHTLSESYSYYYNTLRKRIAKASREVKLEDKAIPVICKVFDGNYNQCYNFARKVVGYLNEGDLKQLVQV